MKKDLEALILENLIDQFCNTFIGVVLVHEYRKLEKVDYGFKNLRNYLIGDATSGLSPPSRP